MLRLTLFGTFSAAGADGTPVPIKSKKARALLAYLALSPQSKRSREEIMALLWSDRAEAQARASLRQVLAGLRKDLSGDALSALDITDDAVALDPAGFTLAGDRGDGELLAGFHLRDPAFEEWLRDERLRQESDDEPAPAPTQRRPAEKRTIAVLPFANLSDDASQDYFAEGMTRDLITELMGFSALSVIAAANVFAFKGERASASELGGRLGADYVLDGDIRKSDRRIRISAQLTNVTSGQTVWGDRFDGELGDIFDIQDHITRLIASNLYLPLMQHGYMSARQRQDADGDAYDLYLQSRILADYPTIDSMDTARRLCRKAFEIDPGFALGKELIMWTHIHEAWNGWRADPVESLRTARREASEGIAIDPQDAGLHGAFGFVEVFLGETERGLGELKTTVEALPSSGFYHTLYGGALSFAGQIEPALATLRQAEQLSPGYHVIRLFEGDCHFTDGRCDEALKSYLQFLTVLPNFSWAWMFVAACHVELDDMTDARDALHEMRRFGPHMSQAYVRELLRSRVPDVRSRVVGALDMLGLPESTAS